ncbi:helix-turn-helix domain-containing protein [Gloeocapsopsis dulcis]|uniref:HTH cro/C1-type domain-containing protein n=1 Tax=Gloeocapsopsis dulcis AAB1 = 1H9 TaxID=1433147 RepID=A0A6N8G395_9CHRO|nr:helix-turn-helix transcriptional regulator [Gloeocapsopsis dulcis]MUL39384.1 hypothetical protein [Gloeocapsopsis dulcis AAB1 = 1H9]WNN92175.1 helix-turn-helix transcriptional regulator [Gloeocapsopsis dulcis]
MKQPYIGRVIREFRLELNLTQEQLANYLGVSWLTVNRWENHHSQPSPLAIKQIDKMLSSNKELNQELLDKSLMNKD